MDSRFLPDLRRLLSLLRPEAWQYAFGLFALLVVNLCEVVGPLFLAIAVDRIGAGVASGGVATGASGRAAAAPGLLQWLGLRPGGLTLLTAIAAYVAVQVVSNVFRYPMLMRTSIPSHRIGQALRNRITGHLLRLSRPFYDRSKSGDLMSLATSDVAAVRMFFGPGVLLLVDTVSLMVFVVGTMLGLSPRLTLAALLPLPLIALITNLFSHAEFDRFAAVQDDLANLTERARESYAGIRILQGYARESEYRRRFADASRRHLGLNLRLARVNALFDPSLDLMLGLSSVLVLVFGGTQIASGAMSVGTFVAFLFLVGNLSGPMVGFGWSVSLLQRARASLRRIEGLLDEPVEIGDAPDARPAAGPGHLAVDALTFAYGGAAPATATTQAAALADVSFDLPPGKRLGIIGPVGSGKTTLVNLLVRLYEPPPGTVRLDGVDVRGLTLDSLRRAVVLAPQDTFLFGDTVARNVLLAEESRDHDPRALAALAQVAGEVEALPQGYDTLLGERGVNLSGGQRQRVAIARALGADPRVLVLDDCLSAVDARTEGAILENLEHAFAGRSGIVVSHRVRAVRRCDEILVLSGGRVAARGTHDELLAQGGYYAEIALAQEQEDAHAAGRADAGATEFP